jgi:hypothetical protein
VVRKFAASLDALHRRRLAGIVKPHCIPKTSDRKSSLRTK